MSAAPAFIVSHGRLVLEGTPDWDSRVRGVASRFTSPTCRHCGGEDYVHHHNGTGKLCKGWRPFGPPSAGERLERMAAEIAVRRHPECLDVLMAELKAALGGGS